MKLRKTVFRNGLTLLTERHRQFRSLAVGVWVKTGTRHERPREAGLSHFLEHMVFKGTERRSALDIAREMDRVGGEFNAFTAREYTCFHITLLDRDVDLAIDILADVILHSRFDAAELERERKVILQEIAMVEESPEELAHDLFAELVHGRHPLGRPILGSEASIRRLRRAEVVRYFRRHYRPEQMVVAVAGDVSHERVAGRLKRMLSRAWPGRAPRGAGAAGRAAAAGGAAVPPVRAGTWWVPRATEQAHVVWGLPGLRYADRDRFAAYLLSVHLGEGMSSQLFQDIREKRGLAYTVYSGLSAYRDAGVFSVYAATSPAQVPQCVQLIREAVARLSRAALSEGELQAVKQNLVNTILMSADSVESRMMSIARNEIFLGRHFTLEEVCRSIAQVSSADVRRVARRMLRAGEPALLVLGPRPSRAVRKRLGARVLKR
jgi:predicted Zn-dependent peptidase